MESANEKVGSEAKESRFKKTWLPILGAGLAIGSIFKLFPARRAYKLRSVKEAVVRAKGQVGHRALNGALDNQAHSPALVNRGQG